MRDLPPDRVDVGGKPLAPIIENFAADALSWLPSQESSDGIAAIRRQALGIADA